MHVYIYHFLHPAAFLNTIHNLYIVSVCLIYVERLMESANVPLVGTTWRPCLLCGLLLASKVWQDLGYVYRKSCNLSGIHILFCMSSYDCIPPLSLIIRTQVVEQRDLADLPAVLDPGHQQAGGHLLSRAQLEPVHLQQRVRQVLLRAAVALGEERLPKVSSW